MPRFKKKPIPAYKALKRKIDDEKLSIDTQDDRGRTMLHHLANTPWKVASSRMSTLLEQGANPHLVDRYGKTPLHLAVTSPSNKKIKMLIQTKADVNAIDNKGNTPLHLASTHSGSKKNKILIRANANVDAIDCNGNTPLHLAVTHSGPKKAKRVRTIKNFTKDKLLS